MCIGIFYTYPHGTAVRPARAFGYDAESHLTAAMLLRDTHIIQPRAVVREQLHITEDPHVRQGRAPIPAKHIRRLAQMRRARHGIAIGAQFVLMLRLTKVTKRGVEADRKFVFTASQQRLTGKIIGAVHIFSTAQSRSV